VQVRVVEFERDCREAITRVRSAIIDLFDALGADPTTPQRISRKFGLNKTLTWNMAKVVEAGDSLAAAPHIPGRSSVEKVLEVSLSHGAPARVVDSLRDAITDFDRMVEVHIGDRADLELMLDSMGLRTPEGAELSRKLAFRGMSGILGVQARTRLSCCLLSPNAQDPSSLDMAMISGFAGIRRLRADMRWPLFKERTWSDQGDALTSDRWTPIGDHPTLPGFTFRHDPAIAEPPSIEPVDTPEGRDFELLPGPIGKSAAFDVYKAEMLRAAAGRYRRTPDETGEFGVAVTTPVQSLVFDLVYHRDLPLVGRAEPLVFSRTFAEGRPTGGKHDASRLPIFSRTAPIPGSPPSVATPLVPGYSTMLRRAAAQLGVDLAEFVAIRLEMDHPPLGSTILLRFPLESPPA
jgi:hypothetical protein